MQLFLGDCLNILNWMPENSIDSVVTDPPYGLSFMGKKWDYDVPSVEIWKEVFRVLKPGGHLLSFGGTRTYHRMVVNIEDAGFEIRDQIQWIYGSGFPKSHNIKEGDFKGFGTALKPANEPIVVARKPLEKGLTVAANVLKWGTGGINVDGCRIESDSMPKPCTNQNIKGNSFKSDNSERERDTVYQPSAQGRWPANILFDEAAAEMLDEQSGVSNSGKFSKSGGRNLKGESRAFGSFDQKTKNAPDNYGDSGGASRFFYVAKASKSERNKGLEGMPEKGSPKFDGGSFVRGENNKDAKDANFHPTVKPIKLMEYLCKLVTPPNGTVLDPFMGSGSTGVAAKNLGFDFVGCEMNEEYFEIAKRRAK